ncbi:uncharacterized protein LOC127810335 [Diospyros lotus]|uniref:uncharacterized protein LOC127810335 n=1 Tax=Diospyros lotus TaxID=55363 RepID=UPI0022527B0A|nr:uncharacterized protein LOC127810335 [Diospyros lotus]
MAQGAVGLQFYPNSCSLMIRKLVQWRHNSFLTPFCTLSLFAKSTEQSQVATTSASKVAHHLPFSGLVLDDIFVGYLFGKKKTTEVAHLVWRQVIQKGDTLVDATCGNGYDTLAMAKMIVDSSYNGHVCSMDVQKVALENTSALLNECLTPEEKRLVELFDICHSKMEEVVPKGVPVRLVAFNLGYLPGSDKAIITRPETTLQALEAAKRLLAPGGLISIVVYIGHPGGREEFEAIEGFAAALPAESWICSKLRMLNRPVAPILVLLFKR